MNDGSIIENRQCACDLNHGYYEPLKGECAGPKPCPAGEELRLDGTCKRCAPGYFKERKSTGPCKNWKE